MRNYKIPSPRIFFPKINTNLIIISLNAIAFLIFLILISSNENLLRFIALKPSNAVNGMYLWTFITSMFMHSGFFHLFVNMFSLIFVGGLVERLLGGKRYLYFYLIAGLFAGIFFVIASWIMLQFGFEADFNTFAVGASGALFGLVGLLIVLTPNLPVYVMFIPIPIKIKYAAPGLLIVLWIISIIANIPIGNTAHLGGLLAGLGYGIFLRKKYKNKTRYIRRFFS